MNNSPYTYVSFYRSRFGFLFTFLSFVVVAIGVYVLSSGLNRVAFLFLLLLGLIVTFFYEFYLSDEPVIELAKDSVMIKEIYHPFIRWRFLYKKHLFGFNTIIHIIIKKDNNGNSKQITFQYADGNNTRNVSVNKRDIKDFGSFVKMIEDSTPGVNKDYEKPQP